MDTDLSLNCCICYKMSDKKKYVVTSCNHYFCTDCFFKWLLEKPSCPLCRKEFIKPPEQEATEELEHLYREIEEFSNYRSFLARNIIREEKELGTLKQDNSKLEKINKELQATNDNLKSTNDSLKTTNDNLKSTNDSLKSTNDNIKSTNNQSTKRQYIINNNSYNIINQRGRNMFRLF